MQTEVETAAQASGILEIHPDGYGFMRNLAQHIEPRPGDVFVPAELIRRFALREGLSVCGEIQNLNGQAHGEPQQSRRDRRDRRGRNQRHHQRAPSRAQGPRMSSVTQIEGAPPEEYKGRPLFDTLTPVDPTKWLRLETVPERLTTRVIDMFTPIGRGTRGLIVAPPRTGKTILLQHVADGISTNHPDVELFVLLIDERPEEVTEMRRCIKGQVFASSNDRETSSHVRLAQLVIERAKRLVEMGKDVVILLDSITRLARAYNKHAGNSGRTMSGGLDVKALDMPKRLFGTARAFDEGGSLTIMATALIETNSRMDEVIFQEFKGTGNMEMVLDRKLADRRVFPSIDILLSGTRKEERLLPPAMLERITLLRRSLVQMGHIEAMEKLLAQLKKFPTNKDFLENIARLSR